jgi:predicted nucleic acid-binding protein
MKVVANTTPLISLASIGKLELLKDIFGEIIIADAVYNEIKAKKGYGYSEIDTDYIKVQSIKGIAYRDFLLSQLDLGETETIILAKEIDADFVIIDENIAYKIAKSSELNVVRTLSILLRAKEKGLIPALKPLLDEMILKGRWYSQRVYKTILEQAGEI